MSNHPSFPCRVRARRIARSALVALTIGGVVPAVARAQRSTPPPTGIFELRPFAGAYVPTGVQRRLFRDAFLMGAQMSFRIVPALAATGTFAWSPNKDHIARGAPLLDVLQYDAGLEARAASWLRTAGWDLTPFVGAGLGGRTYSYRAFDSDPRSKLTGYGAAGGEVGFGRVGVRVEARDYVSRFTPLADGGDSDTRNDVTLTAGLTVRF